MTDIKTYVLAHGYQANADDETRLFFRIFDKFDDARSYAYNTALEHRGVKTIGGTLLPNGDLITIGYSSKDEELIAIEISVVPVEGRICYELKHSL